MEAQDVFECMQGKSVMCIILCTTERGMREASWGGTDNPAAVRAHSREILVKTEQ